MAAYTLWDPPLRTTLFPFTYTRPVAACRVGILTIREKWELLLRQAVEIEYGLIALDHRIEEESTTKTDHTFINGAVIPDEPIRDAIGSLRPGDSLQQGMTVLARRSGGTEKVIPYDGDVVMPTHPWDLCRLNDHELRKDFALLTAGRRSAFSDTLTRLINPEAVFIEPGARVTAAILNASTGPIYIGKDAEVMEGALIRGPFALGAGATVKMGARIYGATTIGPYSVAGGEIKNSVLFGFTNKGHEGYLGDAVIGEWCNLGAGTSCSNLKNNLKPISVLEEHTGAYHSAGLKCGLLMGDYSRTAIHTSFTTGSLVGVSTHVFSDYPPAYLSSFLWAGPSAIKEYRLEQALADAAAWKALKGAPFSKEDKAILTHAFHQTSSYRKSFLNS